MLTQAGKRRCPAYGPGEDSGRARLTQVSLSTVSSVLNEKTNVRPETWQRVLDVIAQVGYSPTSLPAILRGAGQRLLAFSSQIC